MIWDYFYLSFCRIFSKSVFFFLIFAIIPALHGFYIASHLTHCAALQRLFECMLAGAIP